MLKRWQTQSYINGIARYIKQRDTKWIPNAPETFPEGYIDEVKRNKKR